MDISRKNSDGIRKSSKKTINLAALKQVEEREEPVPEEEIHRPTFIEKFAEKEHEEGIILTDEPPLPERKKFVFPKFRPSWHWRWGSIAGGAMLLALAIVLSTVFARATITVKPRVESLALKDISAAFDTSVSRTLTHQKVLPAERLEFSRAITEEFEATGKKFIEDRARAEVRLYNAFSSSPQSLVENTRFLTVSGMLFRLTKTIVIPGAEISEGKIVPKSVEVELIADKAGEESNVGGETKLLIPGFKGTAKYEGFYAVAPSGFSGGFRGEAKVVSKDDLKRAQESLSKRLYDELKAEIARKTPPDFLLIDTLRQIEITKIEAPRENTRRDRFPVEAKGTGKVLVFREADVRDLVRNLVVTEKNKELIDDSLDIQYRVRNIDFGKGKADVVISGEAKLKFVIPAAEFAEMVRGKKEGSIISALKGRSELSAFRVSFFPPWLFSSPNDTGKIRLDIEKP